MKKIIIVLLLISMISCNANQKLNSKTRKAFNTLKLTIDKEIHDNQNRENQKGRVKELYALHGYLLNNAQRKENNVFVQVETDYKRSEQMPSRVYRWNLLSKSIQAKSAILERPHGSLYITANGYSLFSVKYATYLYDSITLTKLITSVFGNAPYEVIGEYSDHIYIHDFGLFADYIYCLDLKLGKVRWKYPKETETNRNFHIVPFTKEKNGKVLIYTNNRRIEGSNAVILDVTTGKEESITSIPSLKTIQKIIEVSDSSVICLNRFDDHFQMIRLEDIWGQYKFKWCKTVVFTDLPKEISGSDDDTFNPFQCFIKDNQVFLAFNLEVNTADPLTSHHSWLYAFDINTSAQTKLVYLGARDPYVKEIYQNEVLYLPICNKDQSSIVAYHFIEDKVLWYRNYPKETKFSVQVNNSELWIIDSTSNQISCLDTINGVEKAWYENQKSFFDKNKAGNNHALLGSFLVPTGDASAQLISFDGVFWDLIPK